MFLQVESSRALVLVSSAHASSQQPVCKQECVKVSGNGDETEWRCGADKCEKTNDRDDVEMDAVRMGR